jgi:hypothetical protein
MPNTKTTNNIIAFAILAIIILLGTTAYFWHQSRNMKKEVVKYDAELTQLTETQLKLEMDYDEAVKSLEELKTDNVELNRLIDQQKAELTAQKNRISSFLRTSKDYDAAKLEIAKLREQAEIFVQEINDLKAQNIELTEANIQLLQDKTILSEQLDVTSSEKQAVISEKESLSREKQELEAEKQRLFVKANKASAISVEKVDIKGYVINKKGKESSERNAEKVEFLKICFNMQKNEIADPGREVFHLRIISPEGTTLYDERSGSGLLTKSDDDTKMNYTRRYVIDYNAFDESVCLVWNKDIPLVKGRYSVEIYNKGYLSGTGGFRLR